MAWIMCIDPGLAGTGIAIGRTDLFSPPEHSDVLNAATKKMRKYAPDEGWINQAVGYTKWLDQWLAHSVPEYVHLEMPELWSGSLKSQTAARATGGEIAPLMKLATLCGMFIFQIKQYQKTKLRLISPKDWKGQLPKDAVHARIMTAYARKYQEHEADAVGMLLAAQRGGTL